MDDKNFSFAANTCDALPKRIHFVVSKKFFHVVRVVFQNVFDDERRESFARAVAAANPNRAVFRRGAFFQRVDDRRQNFFETVVRIKWFPFFGLSSVAARRKNRNEIRFNFDVFFVKHNRSRHLVSKKLKCILGIFFFVQENIFLNAFVEVHANEVGIIVGEALKERPQNFFVEAEQNFRTQSFAVFAVVK